MPSYRHTQPATLIRTLLLGTAGLCSVLTLVIAARGSWTVAVIPAAVAIALAACAWAFWSLTVEVTGQHVTLAFGPGWIRKRIAISEITSATPVQNEWWYGWGIRLTPHGWLYNVSGLDAVEIRLTTGKTLRIGTDEPAALSAAIQRATE